MLCACPAASTKTGRSTQLAFDAALQIGVAFCGYIVVSAFGELWRDAGTAIALIQIAPVCCAIGPVIAKGAQGETLAKGRLLKVVALELGL